MSREVMQQALEALENLTCTVRTSVDVESGNKAITALRRELEKPAVSEQRTNDEPVAWMHPSGEGYDSAFRDHKTVMVCTGNKWEGWIPLYTRPQPARESARSVWVSLTDEEIEHLMDTYDVASPDYARAIEAKLKEKNT